MKFVVKDKNIDYGELQYGYTNAKTDDAPEKHPHLFIEKLTQGYHLFLAAGFFVWYVYSLISHSIHDGFVRALLNGHHLIYLALLIVIETVFFLSIFQWCGKFIRFIFRRKSANYKKERVREQSADKDKETALYIYPSYIVVVKKGIKTVLNRAMLRSVLAKKTETDELRLIFFPNAEESSFSVTLPYRELTKLRDVFAELLSEKCEKIRSTKKCPSFQLFSRSSLFLSAWRLS